MGTNAKTNGHAPAARQMQAIPVLRTTILHVFQCELVPTDDGGQELRFVTPAGEQLVLPLPAAQALELGKALLAPSIAIASAQASADAGALRVN